MYATSEWRVVMKGVGREMIPMNISEASRSGYEFHLTEGRLAFRTSYGQLDSVGAQVNVQSTYLPGTKCALAGFECQQVNGVPVESVHAILFSRQGWIIIIVDLLAACSTREYHHGRFNVRSTF